jgi:hypothetical protein
LSLATQLRIAGLLLVALALVHVAFPKRFGWREELPRLSLLNRQMFVVHCFFIAVVLVLFGLLSFVVAADLGAPTLLSKAMLAAFTTFWALRLCVQVFVYDRRLWRGNRFNTTVHILFCCLWTYLVAVYGAALWSQVRSLT